MLDEQFVSHIGADSERGYFKSDPITGQTSIAGVFAGGDNSSGPAAVIDAVRLATEPLRDHYDCSIFYY